MVIREATPSDASIVAAIHAQSWRSAYRGLLAADYLAREVESDRQRVWQQRFADLRPRDVTVFLAEDETGPIGFACVLVREPERVVLLDNLHVVPDRQGRGVGRRLMHEVGRWAVQRAPAMALDLWVLEKNEAARGFYRALGGREWETTERSTADGGRLRAVRCRWDDPRVLMAVLRSGVERD